MCTFFTYILYAEFQTVKDEILPETKDGLHGVEFFWFQTVKDEILRLCSYDESFVRTCISNR